MTDLPPVCPRNRSAAATLLIHEREKLLVAQRFDEMNAWPAFEQALDGFAHIGIRMHGIHDFDIRIALGAISCSACEHAVERRTETLTPVRGHGDEASLAMRAMRLATDIVARPASTSKSCLHAGLHPIDRAWPCPSSRASTTVFPVMKDPRIPHCVPSRRRFSCRGLRRGEMEVGQRGGERAVDFLGERAVAVEGAQPASTWPTRTF
jgi:hypothetical protein